MSGVAVLVVGLLLCFAGRRSIHLAVLLSGFALGWLLADVLGATAGVAAIVALCSAVVAWVLATFVFRAALFFVGAIAGGVIGAKLFSLLEGGDGNVLLAILFTAAVAVVAGVLVQRFRESAVIWVCAFGGAGLALSGLARIWPHTLGFLRTPDTTAEAIIDAAAWVLLGTAGWVVQRRLTEGRTAVEA